MESKVFDLQANAKLTQMEEHHTAVTVVQSAILSGGSSILFLEPFVFA